MEAAGQVGAHLDVAMLNDGFGSSDGHGWQRCVRRPASVEPLLRMELALDPHQCLVVLANSERLFVGWSEVMKGSCDVISKVASREAHLVLNCTASDSEYAEKAFEIV